MKYVVVCCDGMADRPVPELGGKTPMEVAHKPNMDELCARGSCGMAQTFYPGLPYDSGVANLVLLGYDSHKYYPGRGPLEAAYMNVDFGEGDVAMRVNTLTERDGKIIDFTASHITNEDSAEIIEYANEVLSQDGISFHPGVSYRNLALLKNGYSADLKCEHPHDIVDQPFSDYLIQPKNDGARKTADKLNELMLKSREVLADHPVNKRLESEGKNPANMLWFWGPGKKPHIPSFKKKYGIAGALISAVNILKGTALVIGMDVFEVEGATGYIDTNYEGKADAALKALETHDLAYIHIESTDECGHQGDYVNKVKSIEDIDKRVIGRIREKVEGDYAFAVVMDHATPIVCRCHTDEPVPFLIYDSRKQGDDVSKFTEGEVAEKGKYGSRDGKEFMHLLLE